MPDTLASFSWSETYPVLWNGKPNGKTYTAQSGTIYVNTDGALSICVEDDHYNGSIPPEESRNLYLVLKNVFEPKSPET
jgi:hypothetical protein